MNGFDTVIVDVLSEEAAEKMGRKVGRYMRFMLKVQKTQPLKSTT